MKHYTIAQLITLADECHADYLAAMADESSPVRVQMQLYRTWKDAQRARDAALAPHANTVPRWSAVSCGFPEDLAPVVALRPRRVH